MPRINDYAAPEVEGSAPYEVSSTNIETAGRTGRAVKNLGDSAQQFLDAQYRRQAQQEVSDAQVEGSSLRADAVNNLNDQIRSGTVDTDKIKENFQNYADDNADKYETAHGKQVFQRQMQYTQSMVIKSAARAQAALAGKQASDNRVATLDKDSNAVHDTPENFNDIYAAHMSGIDGDVSTGALPATMAGQAKHEAGVQLAVSSVQGWADMDPSKAQKVLDSGALDTFFNSKTKHQLQGYIDQQFSHKEIEANRVDIQRKKAESAQDESWDRKNFDQVVSGGLPVDDVVKAVQQGQLTPKAGKEQIAMIKQGLKGEGQTNWGLYNQMAKKIAEEQYVDPQEFRQYFGKGLTKQNINDLNQVNDQSDEGKQLKIQRQTMNAVIDSTARFKDPVTLQGYSPLGEQKRGQAKVDLLQAERDAKKSGGSSLDVYDPTKPNYFGRDENLQKYQTPLAQRYQQTSQQMHQDATTTDEGKPKPGIKKSFGDFVKDRMGK